MTVKLHAVENTNAFHPALDEYLSEGGGCTCVTVPCERCGEPVICRASADDDTLPFAGDAPFVHNFCTPK